MKNYLFFTCVLLAVCPASAQKIYFAKTNYADSIQFANAIPALAKQAIDKYQEKDKSVYYDNLLRLQVTAQDFGAVPVTLNLVGVALYGDTTSTKDIGFGFRTYSAAMYNRPKNDSVFAVNYRKVFEKLFNELPISSQGFIDGYFGNDLHGLKKKLDDKIIAASTSDSISVKDAVALCRSYCSYVTYTRTQPLAKQLLTDIEKATYISTDSVLVKMPDGGTVSLTVVRSTKQQGPLPVILKYNIYSGTAIRECKQAVARGYVGIVADTRGKRLSPDAINPFENDAKDAYYIIDWISKQPWCNGKVGMYGGSYLGFSQWSAVKHIHPALKTIVPQVAVGAGIDYPMSNNIFMSYMLRWIHYVTDNKLTDGEGFADVAKWQAVFSKWYKSGSSFKSLDTLYGKANPIFQRWLQHPGYDSYWQNMTPQKGEFAKINIPILSTTGYYDDDQLGALYYYQQYHKYNRNPNYYLLIGPYDHGGAQAFPKASLGGYKIDSVANVQIQDLVFGWFDYILKGKEKPAILKDKVNFEVMGTNKWRHVPAIRNMHNDVLKLYFTSGKAGSAYPLSVAKPTKLTHITQTVNLADRSELRIHSDNDALAYNQVVNDSLHAEQDKMVFMSKPIDKPFAISGAIKASIVASLNKKDMDLVIDLYEQTPDGKYFALTENLQRASYAKDRGKRRLLQPGKVETIPVTSTYYTSKQLQKGSRIVVLLGINKNPDWQINYGTGKDVSDETIADGKIPMKIKWYNNSYIEIPVLR